jgi:hypothetical protein
VSCSHPINDALPEAECATYRAALVAQTNAATFPNVTILDRAALSPLAEMVNAGDFSDTVHLTDAGYIRTERKAWESLLGGGTWRAARARSRPMGSCR